MSFVQEGNPRLGTPGACAKQHAQQRPPVAPSTAQVQAATSFVPAYTHAGCRRVHQLSPDNWIDSNTLIPVARTPFTLPNMQLLMYQSAHVGASFPSTSDACNTRSSNGQALAEAVTLQASMGHLSVQLGVQSVACSLSALKSIVKVGYSLSP